MLSVGIIRTSSLGDVILASWILPALIQAGAQVTWFGDATTLALLQQAYPHLTCIPIRNQQPPTGQLCGVLKRLDVILDLQGNLRARGLCLLARLFGCRVHRYGTARKVRTALIKKAKQRGRSGPYEAPPFISRLRQLEVFLKKANLGPGRPLLIPPFAHLAAHQFPSSDTPWPRQSFFALALGASYATKRAPTAVWAQILGGLYQQHPQALQHKLVLLGTQEEFALGEELAKALPAHIPVDNLAGKLSLTEVAYCLAQAKHLLGNDSGLAHLAEATGTSVGVLYGPTVEAFGFTPPGKSSRAFSSDLGCRPCSKHGKRPCRYGDSGCFFAIKFADVVSHLAQCLDVA